MTRLRIAILALAALAVVPALAAAAEPYRLAPYKDELFRYPRILDEQYGGDYLEVEYDRPRDLYARDTQRGVKVDPRYVSLDTDAVQADLAIDVGGRTIRTFAVGRSAGGARAIVVFIHGRGTGRVTGVDDWIHGGNFNRIKNLMMRNDGLYLSPSFSDFGEKGAAEIKALILHSAGLSPGAPVFLACGSLGARICWRLMHDDTVVPLIGGLILFDPVMGKNDLKAAAALDPADRVPILITGSREDVLISWRPQRDLFRAMKAAVPDYPIRYVLFSAGTHGLSLRMTDWRATLNWMLGVREESE